MGFIRSTKGYEGSDPVMMHNAEVPERVLAPGPAFETNYDNKYKQKTVFANADGRVKIALKPNMHDSEILKAAERVKPSTEPQKTNVQLKTGEKSLNVSRNSLESRDYAEHKIIASTPIKEGILSRQISRPNTS